jgi:hypothetical protein
MPSSAIIDLAIGLIFVFGVTAALASVFTELVSRFIGLRGAYLLTGLRELVDSGEATTDLGKAQEDYGAMREMMQNGTAAHVAQPAPSVTGALLGGPILSSQGIVGQIQARNLTIKPEKRGSLHKMTADQQKRTADQQKGGVWRQRRSLPAYFSAVSFAEAVLDLVAPDPPGEATPAAAGKTAPPPAAGEATPAAAGETTAAAAGEATPAAEGKTTPDAPGKTTAAGETTIMTSIQDNVGRLPDPFKSSLLALIKNAGDDVDRFRTSVERWYDDHMSRVSGWYKRHVAIITLAVGAILIVLLNINVLTIGRTLYSQTAVSTAVSTVAAKGTSCPASQNPQECLARLQAQLSAAAAAGLPIGWGTVRDCQAPGARCNWMDQRGLFSRHGDSFWQFVLVLIGFFLMIIAIVPGAQFWFGLLSKIGAIRSTGPKPAGAGS